MKIPGDDKYWQQIAAHTGTRASGGTPWSVQQLVAGLVGDGVISASAVAYEPAGPTYWDAFVVTEDGRLIRVKVQFDVPQYDFDEEQSQYRGQHPVTSTVHAAWARRLTSGVVRLDVDAVRLRPNRFGEPSRDELDLGGVRLTFADGLSLDFGIDQRRMYDEDERVRADRFITAVRQHTKL
jgi:hypothetical protein